MTPSFGRLPALDDNDQRFPMSAVLGDEPLDLRPKHWWSAGWNGNQNPKPHCVGFSWTHWLDAGPLTQPHLAYGAYASALYHECQRNDEWEGEAYDGTSVRAGAKVLQRRGLITEYRWAFDVDIVIRALKTVGPVVLGTWWHEGMSDPQSGVMTATGRRQGGHAYLAVGVNMEQGLVRIKNSWGPGWAEKGRAWLSFEDLERLIAEDGEACLAVESRAA